MFVGRKKELERLEKMYDKDGLSMSLIYGKRRVGKTELIINSFKNRKEKIIYFQCQRTSYLDNILKINSIISNIFNIPEPNFKQIEDVLGFLKNESQKNKVIFVLDEYPFLKETKKGIDDIFQSFVDQNKDSNLKIILSGSYVNIMKSLLTSDSALYNRFDEILFIEELKYYEIFKLLDAFNDEEKVFIYSVFGGTPYYYKFIDNKLSAKENVIDLVFDKDSPLNKEIELSLKNELSKINLANLIFETIAKGKRTFLDIKNKCNIENPNSLDFVLKKLIEMELIEKKEPISNNKSKKTYYILKDNYFLFYYRYIYGNESLMYMIDKEEMFNILENDIFKEYVPFIYENISKDFIICLNKNNYFKPLLIDIGRYWFDDKINKTNGEFDVVGLTLNKDYIVFEVKYTNELINKKIIDHLLKQIELSDLRKFNIGFISKSGFDDESLKIIKENNYYAFTLKDIINLSN